MTPAPASPFSASLVSGERALAAAAFAERIARAASGFAALGLERGDCAALLLRNDFAFLEASLAAVRIGAYAVPINWHFKAEEVAYVLADCGAKVLVAHADLLAAIADAIPAGVKVLVVETPPELRARLRHRRRQAAPHRGCRRLGHLARGTGCVAGRAAAADVEHDLHVRHHGPAQGRAPPAAHRRTRSAHGRLSRARLRPHARRAHDDSRARSTIPRPTRLHCAPPASRA